VSIANVRDMSAAIETGSRSNGDQRAIDIFCCHRHLDEAQGKCAAIETMTGSATTPRALRARVVVIAIQGPPCWNQLVDRYLTQIALLVAEQSGGCAIARRDATFSTDQYRCRGPVRQRQSNDRRSQRTLFPSLVVTVPAWRPMPRLATTASRPNGFHRSPLQALIELNSYSARNTKALPDQIGQGLLVLLLHRALCT
jgi:hypothetical protein